MSHLVGQADKLVRVRLPRRNGRRYGKNFNFKVVGNHATYRLTICFFVYIYFSGECGGLSLTKTKF